MEKRQETTPELQVTSDKGGQKKHKSESSYVESLNRAMWNDTWKDSWIAKIVSRGGPGVQVDARSRGEEDEG